MSLSDISVLEDLAIVYDAEAIATLGPRSNPRLYCRRLCVLNRETRDVHEIIVVLDGYRGIKTKGHKQSQRGPVRSLDIVRRETVLEISVIVFFSNLDYKQAFIDLIGDTINSTLRLSARKSSGDADRSIVSTAVEALQFQKPVLIKADDTDVLVLCLSERSLSERTALYLKRGDKVYNIQLIQAAIQPSLINDNLSLLNCFYGCDTTSGFFGRPSYRAIAMPWEHLAGEFRVHCFQGEYSHSC